MCPALSARPVPATALLGTEKAALSLGLALGHRAQATEGPLSATGRVLGGLGTGVWVWWGQEGYKESEWPHEATRVGRWSRQVDELPRLPA